MPGRPSERSPTRLAAEILGPLVREVVFVGGATIHLWIEETTAPAVRFTDDVDVICDVHTRGDYYGFAERLRDRGLAERMDEPVVCRWRHGVSGLVIDVMPTSEEILGFTNPWYQLGIATAVEVPLASGTTILAMHPAVTLASKLAAWNGRGRGDVLTSYDAHDRLVLINGRPSLVDEIAEQPAELQQYVRVELQKLSHVAYFGYAIHDVVRGYGSQSASRAAVVSERVAALIA